MMIEYDAVSQPFCIIFFAVTLIKNANQSVLNRSPDASKYSKNAPKTPKMAMKTDTKK